VAVREDGALHWLLAVGVKVLNRGSRGVAKKLRNSAAIVFD